MPKPFRLSFLGGVGSVTGANFLLEGDGIRLLVDCGMEQGCKFCEDINREAFPYDPASIDVLLVTHAHMDHIGRIPLLVKRGFRGVIYSTPGTRELSEVMLRDSIGILIKESKRDNLAPLYDEHDAEAAFSLWKNIPYHVVTDVPGGLRFEFKDAGHILGSATIEVTRNGGEKEKLLFTGDLGNSPAPLLRDTELTEDATYVVMESVYGDRVHPDQEKRKEVLRSVIRETVKKKGVLLIPAFSLERTQILLYELNNMIEDGVIPQIPVFLDSPLAIAVTDIYKKRIHDFNQGVRKEIEKGDDIFSFPGLKMTLTSEESKAIDEIPSPKIVIAGAGMSHGGRIQHHERRYLPLASTTLLLVGYQVAGSVGRLLQDGAKNIYILGESVPVRASVVTLSGYSAHKDLDGLLSYAEHFAKTVKTVFVTMGEMKSALFLVQRLRDYLDVQAVAPDKGEVHTVYL